MMVKSPSGYPIQSPYVSIANRQAEIMMRIVLLLHGFPYSIDSYVEVAPMTRHGGRLMASR
jgi:hypothetical protein